MTIKDNSKEWSKNRQELTGTWWRNEAMRELYCLSELGFTRHKWKPTSLGKAFSFPRQRIFQIIQSPSNKEGNEEVSDNICQP